MKQQLLFKLSSIANYWTEDRIQKACIVWIFAVILCSETIANAICKLLGV